MSRRIPDRGDVFWLEFQPQRGILSDQVKSLDWKSRQARFLCHLPETVTDQVLAKLNTLLAKSSAESTHRTA